MSSRRSVDEAVGAVRPRHAAVLTRAEHLSGDVLPWGSAKAGAHRPENTGVSGQADTDAALRPSLTGSALGCHRVLVTSAHDRPRRDGALVVDRSVPQRPHPLPAAGPPWARHPPARPRHAGLPPPGWWLVKPGHSRADNDVAHRFEQILGGGGNYRMPNPMRQLILTDLDHRPITDDVAPPTQRW